jgi:protoporphyrinogen oxidase
MEPVVILGGGLAGLAAASFCRRPWILIEREDRVGGLTRTERVHGGFLFDVTGHWLHLRDEGMRRWVRERLLPEGLVAIERKAAILTHGRFTRFPYQVNTHGLPPPVVVENVLGFVEAQLGEQGRELREREPANFEEFILRYLGEGFAKNFMVPYNQKLWTAHPRELSAAWCGRFVPKPTLREVLEGALGIVKEGLGYNASFLYPKEGGIEALPRAIASSLQGGEVLVSLEPVAVDWKQRSVQLSNGRTLRYAQLVSTIALPRLIELLVAGGGVPGEVHAAAGRLKATTVTYVNVGARGANAEPWHWVYLPEPQFRAYRIGSPSAVYPPLAPKAHCSFYVEYSHRGELRPQDCEAFARTDLSAAGLVRRPEDILFAEAREIPHAYVLYDSEYGGAKAEVLQFLNAAGIQTAGRYGGWEYSSMEDALLAGKACAERLPTSGL